MIIVNDKQLKTLIVKKEHILKMHTQKISTSEAKDSLKGTIIFFLF